LKEKSIDAVVLATPHTQHCEQIVAAARARKHVFVEKPLGVSHEEARKAAAACAKHQVTLAVGYNWRFQPALREIRRLLADGRLGKLLHIEAKRHQHLDRLLRPGGKDAGGANEQQQCQQKLHGSPLERGF
jgi:predicted dehydrogenase